MTRPKGVLSFLILVVLVSGDPCRVQGGEPAVEALLEEVSRLRGLPVLKHVPVLTQGKEFFRDHYRQALLEQYPPEIKGPTERAFALLGFLPPGGDLIEIYLDAYLRVVRGVYDPGTGVLYLAEGLEAKDREDTLVHELVHALQDQHFDLGAFLRKGQGATLDEQYARMSVMEGEATALTLERGLRARGADFTRLGDIAEWNRLAALFKESGDRAFGRTVVSMGSVNFPYLQGASFLQRYVRAYGWEGVGRLYRDPPVSTRHLLHPEEFFPVRRPPLGVGVEDLSGGVLKGMRLSWETTLGEYGLSLLLGVHLPATESLRKVSSWRGDRVQVYEAEEGSGSVLLGYVVFSDEEGADGFFRAYRELLGKKHGVTEFRRADGTIHWAVLPGGEGEAYLERVGPRVVFLEGTKPGSTAKVRRQLWDVHRIKGKSRPARP